MASRPFWITIGNALAAAAFAGLSLLLWQGAYEQTDWAVLALAPLALALTAGAWPLARAPWRASLRVALREGSPLERIMTGWLRATVLSLAFAVAATAVLAWQALDVTAQKAAILLGVFCLSALAFSLAEAILGRHLHQPFARAAATSLITWTVALPFAVLFAAHTWWAVPMPGEVLGASLREAMALNPRGLPDREGWITSALRVLQSWESAKLWAVVQLPEHPVAGVLYSLDAALFAFLWCRGGIVMTQVVEDHVTGGRDG